MNLKLQIYSFVFSFLFGIILSVFTNLNYRLLFNKNKKIKILGNFLFLFDFSLIYFLGIKLINNGILHIYFLLLLILGFLLSYSFYTQKGLLGTLFYLIFSYALQQQ